jgi:hypothetical protein
MFINIGVIVVMSTSTKRKEIDSIRSAEAVEEAKKKLEWIKERLAWIETPILLEDFKKKLVENLTKPIWGKRPCNTVEVEWDIEPFVDKWINLSEKITYAKTYEVDVIICDNKRYVLESENEYYYTPVGDIVHSFKIVNVKEKTE